MRLAYVWYHLTGDSDPDNEYKVYQLKQKDIISGGYSSRTLAVKFLERIIHT